MVIVFKAGTVYLVALVRATVIAGMVLALATGDIKMEFARNSATRSVGPAPTLGMSASSAQTCTREREETA